jgi:hypothetical protein
MLGRPVRSFTIYRSPEMPMIDIETYRAPWDSKVRVVTSVGLSHYTERHGERSEVILVVDREQKAAERGFAGIVSLLAEEPEAFGIGQFYTGERSFGAIAGRYGKAAMVLLAQPFVEPQLFHVECDGQPGHVLALVPITFAERDLLVSEGLAALEARLAGLDLSDLSRESVA